MIRRKCDECGGKLAEKMVDFNVDGILIGKFKAEVCIKCGEEVFSEKVSKAIERETKKKGLFGRKFEEILIEA